jgi:hypothetical protein
MDHIWDTRPSFGLSWTPAARYICQPQDSWISHILRDLGIIMASELSPDSSSYYGQGSFSTVDLQSEEPFSIDLLLSRVEELQRSEKLETLQKLTHRNALLQQVVIDYQQQWCCTLALLEKTHEARLSVQKAMERCVNESAAAERTWLAYWGIKKEHCKEQNDGTRYAGWI